MVGMGKKYPDEELNKVMALYSILCTGEKTASIQYLDGISGVCKIENTSLRKNMFRERIENLKC